MLGRQGDLAMWTKFDLRGDTSQHHSHWHLLSLDLVLAMAGKTLTCVPNGHGAVKQWSLLYRWLWVKIKLCLYYDQLTVYFVPHVHLVYNKKEWAWNPNFVRIQLSRQAVFIIPWCQYLIQEPEVSQWQGMMGAERCTNITMHDESNPVYCAAAVISNLNIVQSTLK